MTQRRMAFRGRFNDGGLVALTGTLIIYGLIYSHFMSFLTSKAGISSTPVYLVVIGLGLVLASGVFVRRRLSRSSVLIMAAVAAYVFILLASLLFLDESAWTQTYDRLFWAMMTLSAIVLLSNFRNPRQFLLIIRVVTLLSVAIVMAEFLSGFSLPIEMTTVRGRAGGLFENPNNAALFITMALPIVTIGLKPHLRAIWYALTLTCVFLTFSRGGLAVGVLAIILIEVLPAERGGSASLHRLAIGLLLVAIAAPLYFLISSFVVNNFSSVLDANTLARVRLEGDSSSDIRLHLLRLAWEEFSASPIWGHGTGSGYQLSEELSVHNQFALVAVEYGAIGLAWLGAFLAALWSIPRPFGIWAASLFVVAGMTTHNLTDGATYALIVATYAALPAVFAVQRASTSAARSRFGRPVGRYSGRLRGPEGGLVRNNQTGPAFRAWPPRPPAGGSGG